MWTIPGAPRRADTPPGDQADEAAGLARGRAKLAAAGFLAPSGKPYGAQSVKIMLG